MRSKADRPRVLPATPVYGAPGSLLPRGLHFDPADRAFLDREPDRRYRVRVRGEPGLTDPMVVVRRGGRDYGWGMEVVGEGAHIVVWETIAGLEPGDEISLAFRDRRGRGVYLCPGGITNAVERLDRWVVPDLAPLAVPAWARGVVIYHIFPDRFANGDPGNDPPGSVPWGSEPRAGEFQGGDLTGITSRLDHLAGLGVDLIYITPIFTSPSPHGYDAIDYHRVDPRYGGNAALAELVDAAHQRGMRVILDASVDHCHPGFFAFQDLIRNGPDSRYRDWFVVHDWPVRVKVRRHEPSWQKEGLPALAEATGLPIEYVDDEGPAVEPSYQAWYGVASMPRVDLAQPEARRYMLGVIRHWLETGIDGWRMDVARYVDPDFWLDFRRTAKEVDAEAYLLAEIMGDASAWLQGDRFDATMNYTFREICVAFLARNEIDAAEAGEALTRLWGMYAWPVTLANQNLISSHDTPRFLSEAGGEVPRLRLAMVLQMTFPGCPSIYYGDEAGMRGGDDPDSRGAFPWDPDPSRHPLYRELASLAELRRREPALVVGDWRLHPSSGSLLIYERRLDRRRLLVVINRGRRRQVELPRTGRMVWGDATLTDRRLAVAGFGAAIVGW